LAYFAKSLAYFAVRRERQAKPQSSVSPDAKFRKEKVFAANCPLLAFRRSQIESLSVSSASVVVFDLTFHPENLEPMNKHLVFVYGTLRHGSVGAMSLRFPNSKFIAGGAANGRLYDLGAYPGLLADESSSPVVGEVYEVDDETLRQLDEFEGSSNYSRRQVEVLTGDDLRTCWTYEPDPESCFLRTLITSGDWIEYAKTKTDWPEGRGPGET
jgi:gamma-glutamylcyclotransferase (GGCT)/AIG2-like uncharacterized protein YtfP